MERTITRAALALLLAAPLARAQAQATFTSGSNGSDGALTVAGGQGAIDFNPTSFNPALDADGDNVYHFTTITIGAGTTLRLRTNNLPEGRPVVWLASGAVTIEGTLDLDGDMGHHSNGPRAAAFGGGGGYSSGVGGNGVQTATNGNGPGGGPVTQHHGGSAAHAGPGTVISDSVTTPAAPYGNAYVRPLVGGSGGAGGVVGPGGGGGGGALLLASSVSITITGTIQARGGPSGVQFNVPHVGGGGSGGALRLIAPEIRGPGPVLVHGGGSAVNNGSPGRVRLEAFRFPSLPSVQPNEASYTRGVPGPVFEPATAPTIKIVRIGGVAVAAEPTGSFVMPDAVISAPGPVTVELEARNVPVGTVLNLTFQPEVGSQFTANSTPLAAGTGGVATASASVTFPGGFTRVFVKASWTP